MAFSKELEAIIEAALADGVITEKERAVLHKKALLEGVDPDELDVVIEGRLSKMKREEDWLKPAPPASEKRGNIVKCPNCGAPIQAGAVKCDECGYVFTNVAANRSSEVLARKISELLSNHRKTEHVIEEIANFPIPTSKEDLMEFIASMDSKRKEEGPLRQAYTIKYKESITKAKIFFATDSQVMALVKNTDKFFLTKTYKKWIFIIAVAFIAIFSLAYSCSSANKEYMSAVDAQYQSLETQLDALPTPTEDNYDDCAAIIRKMAWKDVDRNSFFVDSDHYQYSRKEAMKDKINAYIRILQGIQRPYICPLTGKQTDYKSHKNGKSGTCYHDENPKYVETIILW